MAKKDLCNRSVESIDNEKIIIDDEGKFPRRMILTHLGKIISEYRIILTKGGHIILNK